jgi:hypothetical protein
MSDEKNVDITSLMRRISALEAENNELRSALEKRKEPSSVRKRRKQKDKEIDDSFSEQALQQPRLKKQKQDPNPKLVQRYLKKWGKAVDRKVTRTKFKRDFPDDPFLGEVVIEDTIVKDTFEAIFKDKGHVLQPRADNKPTSVLHIIEFVTWPEIEALFGQENLTRDQNKVGWVWESVPFFGLRRAYQTRVQIDSLRVEYNRTKMKLRLLFTCSANESDDGSVNLLINRTTNILDYLIGVNPLQVLSDPTQRQLLPQQIQQRLQLAQHANTHSNTTINNNNNNK